MGNNAKISDVLRHELGVHANPMKWQGTAVSIGIEGEALVRSNDHAREVWVFGPLPGEIVEIDQPEGSDITRWKLVGSENPARVVPKCSVFGKCGGCQLQHLNYAEQLLLKREQAKHQLARRQIFLNDDSFSLHGLDNPWFYRTRIQLRTESKPSKKIGFYGKGTQTLVPIQQCSIADERFASYVEAIKLDIARHDGSHKLEVYVGDDSQVHHVWDMPHGAATGFRQVNPLGNELLCEEIRKRIQGFPKNSKVVELYAGAGNLTKLLAKRFSKITAVESDYKCFKEGAKQLPDVSFQFGTAEGGNLWDEKCVDVILADPPRMGLSKEVMDRIRDSSCRELILVSCDLVAGVGNISYLEGSFEIVTPVAIIDMFPQTKAMEIVWHLRRRS